MGVGIKKLHDYVLLIGQNYYFPAVFPWANLTIA